LSCQALWSAPSPKTGAQGLLQMLGHNGTTVEAIRELVSIPAEAEQLLPRVCRAISRGPEDIERVIEFRQRIGEEFERLLGLGNMLEQ
jgi:hypothetical protein